MGAEAFQGIWHGVLAAGSQRLRLRLEIEGARATLFSLDQGADPIPASQFTVRGERIEIAFAALNGRFAGRLTSGAIDGEWRQGGVMPLRFTREPSAAPEPAPALTDERLVQLRARADAPALAAAARRADGATRRWTTGLRRMDRPDPVTASDLWHLGSITKSMTATLVARCVEAGDIAWDDTLFSLLGAAAPDMRAEYRSVTFRHLLSHRAGLPANLGMIDLLRYARESADSRAERLDYARKALAQAPAGPKETTFLYSNSGYVLAGAMLEQKLGARWEDLIAARVFAPLSMTHAGFGAPGTRGRNDQPVGHSEGMLRNNVPHPPGEGVTDNPAVLGPAGRVHASLDDVLAYLAAHAGRTSFLSAQSWSMLHTPPFGGDYAMGWEKRGDALWHNGSNTLWYAEVVFDPAKAVAAVAATNSGRLSGVAVPVGEVLLAALRAAS